VAAEAEAENRHETGAPAVPPPAAAPAEVSTPPAAPADTERYELLDRIGVGGMAEVYKARASGAHGFQKIVAIKRILPELAARPEFVARFIAEAKLAVALTHANIVQVLDLAREADRLYIAMEYVEGGDLALLMRSLARAQEKAPVGFALFVGIEMLRGLHHAHSRKDEQGRPLGIVHRDVSPSNILLSLSGEVKVADFGIARAAWAAHLPERVMGKRRYMSPEQARGDEDLDHRADIWALGVLLYECLTGEVPFRANNYLQIISQVLTHEPLSPSRLRPELGIPDAIDAVVMRAMEKDRARRYQTMAELEGDLERLLAGDQNVGLRPALVGVPPAVRAAAPKRWPLVLVALVVLAGGVTVALRRPAVVIAPALPVPARPPSPEPTSGALPARPTTAKTPAPAPAPAPAPSVRPTAHPRPRVERHVVKPTPADPASADSVKRGVLPPASKEGYPDK
jgi:tRNA A-37 threonylcarbamoyl transferase component Bud32